MVPVGLKPPTMVPVSEAELPTTIELLESVVVTEAEALVTDKVSEPHAVESMLLFTSPLYVACKLKVPVELRITLMGPADPEDRVAVLLITMDPVQSIVEYTLKVTVPVGLKPRVTLAESITGLPTTTVVADSVEETDGVALITERDSDPQVLLATSLFESPLYVACKL